MDHGSLKSAKIELVSAYTINGNFNYFINLQTTGGHFRTKKGHECPCSRCAHLPVYFFQLFYILLAILFVCTKRK